MHLAFEQLSTVRHT